MKDVLTFMIAQAASILIFTGLVMGYQDLRLWGLPLIIGGIFFVGAILNHHDFK